MVLKLVCISLRFKKKKPPLKTKNPLPSLWYSSLDQHPTVSPLLVIKPRLTVRQRAPEGPRGAACWGPPPDTTTEESACSYSELWAWAVSLPCACSSGLGSSLGHSHQGMRDFRCYGRWLKWPFASSWAPLCLGFFSLKTGRMLKNAEPRRTIRWIKWIEWTNFLKSFWNSLWHIVCAM